MRHYKQRVETDCLNCGSQVTSNYCGYCGQENIEPKISFWHLVTHFFNDITHFDGKFFTTLSKLITKPGFLSLAFMKGQRMRYLDPVRMYIFTSFLFFLIFFSYSKIDNLNANIMYGGKSLDDISKLDSTNFSNFSKQFNNGLPMDRAAFEEFADVESKNVVFNSKNKYSTLAQFDSLNNRKEIAGNAFEKIIKRKQLEVQIKYKNDQNAYIKYLFNSLSHSLPQLLFISLPLFALCLKLLYFRHKNIYFAQHIIYAIHLYIFTFLILFDFMFNSWLKVYVGESLGGILILIFIIWLGIYEYKAMRKFYNQKRFKTILKFLMAVFLRLIVILLLFFIFAAISFYKS